MPPPTRKPAGAQQSGNPAKRAATRRTYSPAASGPQSASQDRYAPTAWGSTSGMPEDLELPSGQVCLVRRPGTQGLIAAGVLQNVDSLTRLVNEKHINRVAAKGRGQEAKTEIDMTSLMDDPEGMAEIVRVVDKVVIHCVLAPQVFSTPDDVTRREKGVIYADMIDLTDKMFLFQYVVGGTRDLESFRTELNEVLGGLGAEQGVPAAAKPALRNR